MENLSVILHILSEKKKKEYRRKQSSVHLT